MPKAKTIDRIALTLSHSTHLRRRINCFRAIPNEPIRNSPPDIDTETTPHVFGRSARRGGAKTEKMKNETDTKIYKREGTE